MTSSINGQLTVSRHLPVSQALGHAPTNAGRWRRNESGPKFIKAQHPVRVLYPILEVESYEQQNPFLKK